ncbi:hypothetical protein ACU8KO_002619 [Vibrio alginolyticus]
MELVSAGFLRVSQETIKKVVEQVGVEHCYMASSNPNTLKVDTADDWDTEQIDVLDFISEVTGESSEALAEQRIICLYSVSYE